jgi:NAD-dependent SIR2 family protein deacetylase
LFFCDALIKDFRGANGVWTKQRKGESVSMPKFENTKPTKAHMACKALYDAKVLTKIVTQNVDGLHQRAGVPEDAIAELHGSVYKERCSSCERIYTRDFDVTSTKPSHGKNRHRTGRMCEVDKCDGYLKDTIVQFGESLDEETLEKAREWSREAKMSVVVGSSLRVPPASTLPRMAKKHCVVVNLQWTSQDAKATLKLHAKADDILVKMCKHLGLKIPEYDPLTESVGRKVKERGEIFACEVKETAWNEKGRAMRDIDEKLKEATTGMDTIGKTNARILFGEADGGKKLSKTAREALIRDEKRLKEEREGKVNATKTTTRKRKSKSLTMKPRSKMPCFPRPGSKQTPLTNTSPPLFDASKIVKKKRTPLKKRRSMVTKKEEQKMDKEERMKPKVATAVPIVVKTEQVAVLPPSDEDIARMLFAEINGMRRRR